MHLLGSSARSAAALEPDSKQRQPRTARFTQHGRPSY
jgi:hypothetical protein